MAKQTFTAGQVLTAAEMNSLQENDYNWTVTTKTASYTLAAGDEGTRIVMNNAGATTITVDDAIFSAGDVVWLHNIGAGTCTVTAGTATVNTAASLDLAQWEGGSLYFTSASSAIFFRGPAAGVGNANFTDTATGTYSSGGTNYKYLTFTSSGTITIDTAGLADILLVGGGGGAGRAGSTAQTGGGGAGDLISVTDAYLPVGTLTVVVGAGGAGATVNDTSGGDGSYSNLEGYYALGGGASNAGNASGNGASGAGAIAFNSAGLIGRALGVNGNDGGDGFGTSTVSARACGGGGGSGAVGGNASSATGGNGGAGSSNSITGSAVTRAAGGGGGGYTTGGSGGSSIGGDGGTNGVAGTAATANTGSGGGGAGNSANGGNGGSGVVIVRVEV